MPVQFVDYFATCDKLESPSTFQSKLSGPKKYGPYIVQSPLKAQKVVAGTVILIITSALYKKSVICYKSSLALCPQSRFFEEIPVPVRLNPLGHRPVAIFRGSISLIHALLCGKGASFLPSDGLLAGCHPILCVWSN